MSMDRRTFLASLAAAPLAAQEDPVIKVDVELVSLLCSVRDKRGKFIKTLEKPDFTILEDGKKQDVRNFSRESDLPLTIGLLVDVSGSQRNLIEIERRAAGQFFKQVLREKDMAFLISFGAEAELLQDSTNSVRLLQKGLDGLRVNSGVGESTRVPPDSRRAALSCSTRSTLPPTKSSSARWAARSSC